MTVNQASTPASWKTLLFLPLDSDRFLNKAHERGADAYIIDLEDGLAPEIKPGLLNALPSKLAPLKERGLTLLGRVDVNSLVEDARALVNAGVNTIVIPKLAGAEQLRDYVNTLDAKLDVSYRIIGQIESIHALPELDAIACISERLVGLVYGTEDFALSASMEPNEQTLYWPCQQLVFACRRQGILPFGFPGSIAVFRDEDMLHRMGAAASAMGFSGALCIHPTQVNIFNQHFTPSDEQVAEAKEIIQQAKANQAQNKAVFSVEGKMVDAPVIRRAEEILARAKVDVSE
jgi:citrate lyase subunit beta/citryl-CoA lyase